MGLYKVFFGMEDTFHPDEYYFIGSWEECREYTDTLGESYWKMAHIFPA